MAFIDQSNRAPTAQLGPQDSGEDDGSGADWLKRAQDAYRDSTSYVDNNYRKVWDDSIRAFHNQHSSDSKYNMPQFEKRSRLFRPKLRSVIRKNEAAGAAAFFSNMDVVNVAPQDPGNKVEVASAEIMKQLLQYRLTKTIPWFQIVQGGLQDAQSVGVACAHIYWEFEAAEEVKEAEEEVKPMGAADDEYAKQSSDLPKGTIVAETPDQLAGTPESGDTLEPPSEDEYKGSPEVKTDAKGKSKPVIDCPVVDLFPVENLRIDPGSNWVNPIESSPYVIHLMPMYVMDVKAKMESRVWRKLSDGMLRRAQDQKLDTTRTSRNTGREDPYTPDGKSLPDYEIVWVQRHIHREDGQDYEFYTLHDVALLSTPRPLKETVFHGKRPYVMGVSILETHKLYPSSIPVLGRGLSDESNEIANQRIDNVKFVLNKKWFAKRGRDVDIGGLVRNVPGGVVMLEDPEGDVREINWPDVTSSAYEEQSRIDQDMNDLLGNFSAAQVVADHGINGPAHNMAMLGQSAGTLVEYLLRTYVETFVQPVLRHIMMLEQKYETDQTVLAIVGKQAQLHQKYGMDQVTDELLEQELTLTVNVGMGATDPQMKLQKFLMAMDNYVRMMKGGVPGLNLAEVGKEIFGHLGYADGARFFTNENPQVAMMQQQIQQLNKALEDANRQVKEKMTGHQVKKEIAEIQANTKIQETAVKEDHMDQRNAVTHLRAIREQDKNQAHEIAKLGITKRLEAMVGQAAMADAPKKAA